MKTTLSCFNCGTVCSFTIRKKKKYNTPFFCKNCRKEEQRAIRKTHPEVMKERELKKNFNLTLEQYAEKLNNQNGVCAICERPEFRIRKGKLESLGVDHNHTTNQIRGLLCHTCNSALGLFKDSPELLEKAIKYLRKYNN